MVAYMASVTVKALPPSLHRALKSRAKLNRRSLNQEVIAVLEQSVVPSRKIGVKELIEDARKFRSKMKFIATPEEIDRFKRAGRK